MRMRAAAAWRTAVIQAWRSGIGCGTAAHGQRADDPVRPKSAGRLPSKRPYNESSCVATVPRSTQGARIALFVGTFGVILVGRNPISFCESLLRRTLQGMVMWRSVQWLRERLDQAQISP